jgi:restriction endonuclease Mrr
MATLLHAQVIVIATTGTVSKTVCVYAQRVSETTPFQVVLVDGEVLQEYRRGRYTCAASSVKKRQERHASEAPAGSRDSRRAVGGRKLTTES